MHKEHLNFFVNTQNSHCGNPCSHQWDDFCGDSWDFPCPSCKPKLKRPRPSCKPSMPCPCTQTCTPCQPECNPCHVPCNPCQSECNPCHVPCNPCQSECAHSLSDLLNRYKNCKVIFTIGTCSFAVIVCHSSSHFVEVMICKTGKIVFFNLKKLQNVEPVSRNTCC